MPSVDLVVSCPVERTPRVQQMEGMFDVSPAEKSEVRWRAELPIEEREWSVGLIVGPSGCGKSTLARELFGKAVVTGHRWPKDKSILDGFPSGMGIKDITGLLSSVGFSSPPAWLRPFRVLSTGQQFRVTIARALAESPDLAVIDEFTSVVDRTVAQIGSAAVSKAVRRAGKRLVAVTCHYDIIEWLDPDWVYEPEGNAFHWRSERQRPPIELEFVRAGREAWDKFRSHHYLSGLLSKSASCFVASLMGQPAAFASVIHRPSTNGGYWAEHRTVCLPDFQGVGIGNAVSELVASVFAGYRRKRYMSVTASPAMIAHRMRSPNWRCYRSPSLSKGYGRRPAISKNKNVSRLAISRTTGVNRLAAGFTWVGPQRPELRESLGLAKAPASRDGGPGGGASADSPVSSRAVRKPTASQKQRRRSPRPPGPRRRQGSRTEDHPALSGKGSG